MYNIFSLILLATVERTSGTDGQSCILKRILAATVTSSSYIKRVWCKPTASKMLRIMEGEVRIYARKYENALEVIAARLHDALK